MEFEFDKEIDAILRKARESSFAFSENSPTHLDADEISAFAENALPEKAKTFYTKHLADCERCRQLLSNIILLNAEAETVPAFTLSEEKNLAPVLPWYRRLFVFPNLAYSLGALVLVFGGLIGFTVLQSSNQADISQMNNKAAESKSAPVSATNAANSMMSNPTTTTANTAMNSNSSSVYSSNMTTANTTTTNSNLNAAKPNVVPNQTPPQDALKTQSTPAIVQNEAATTDSADKDVTSGQTSRAETVKKSEEEQKNDDSRTRMSSPSTARQKENNSTKINDKTFNRRDNVSYDSAYNGQATTNITRGSDEYKKLDAGLRQTVERLGGTVVIVWKGKAYRIQ